VRYWCYKKNSQGPITGTTKKKKKEKKEKEKEKKKERNGRKEEAR
jgi:hypothetical protein